MKILIYPGSFDPFTKGHVDIARRAAKLCDKLYVSLSVNANKGCFFSTEERLDMIKKCLVDLPNVEVIAHDGLLVDLFKQKQADAVVRGLRSESDFRFESEMATANKLLYKGFEAILLPCRMDLAFTSSSIVREVASFGGDISGMVPEEISEYVARRMRVK